MKLFYYFHGCMAFLYDYFHTTSHQTAKSKLFVPVLVLNTTMLYELLPCYSVNVCTYLYGISEFNINSLPTLGPINDPSIS
jgi:hypothetical protein